MRIQKSVCDLCGKEVPTNVSIFVDGINIRFGGESQLSYLRNEDFCSVECLTKAMMKLEPHFKRQMIDAIKKVRAKK